MSFGGRLLKVEPGARNVIGEAAGGELRLLPLYASRTVHTGEATLHLRLAGTETLDAPLAALFPPR